MPTERELVRFETITQAALEENSAWTIKAFADTFTPGVLNRLLKKLRYLERMDQAGKRDHETLLELGAEHFHLRDQNEELRILLTDFTIDAEDAYRTSNEAPGIDSTYIRGLYETALKCRAKGIVK